MRRCVVSGFAISVDENDDLEIESLAFFISPQIKRLYSEKRHSTLQQDSDLATQPVVRTHRITSYHSISL